MTGTMVPSPRSAYRRDWLVAIAVKARAYVESERVDLGCLVARPATFRQSRAEVVELVDALRSGRSGR